MNRSKSAFATLATVLLLSFGLEASEGAATPNLVGTWQLVAYEDHPQGKAVEYPFGEKPVGLLIYDSTGHMSIQIMKAPRSHVASGDDEKITSDEKIALLDSYVAYFGSYSVDWKKKIVTHKVDGDLYDIYVGTTQERPFELKGDQLVLRPTWSKDGVPVTGIRTFRRAK